MKKQTSNLLSSSINTDQYQLVEQDFLQSYKFGKFKGKWHLDVYMENEKIGMFLLDEHIDCLIHALKKTSQFIHVNLQKFIEKIQIHAQQHIDDSEQSVDWKMESNMFIHALKEIQFLQDEADSSMRYNDAFLQFEEIHEAMNTKNMLSFNPNPAFSLKMIWGF